MERKVKTKILVSACLYGQCCRYDGKSNLLKNKDFLLLKNQGRLLPFCPEIEGGLSCPRVPSEIVDGRVLTKEGRDVTEEFEAGAEQALQTAKENGIRVAILKQGSPSCGCKQVYDGSFSGKKISGEGICAEKLIENGIVVFDETEVAFAKLLADGNPHH